MHDDQFGLDIPKPVDGTLLGFDFGTKRIGVAVGQTITLSANPLTPLAARDGIPDSDILASLIKTWSPQGIVVGMPINPDYPEQPILVCAKKFARRLRHHFKIPVFGMDERFTTREARYILLEEGGQKALEKNSVDSLAARLILESWLRTYCVDTK